MPIPPARRTRASAYDAASTGRRAKGWVTTKDGPNSLIYSNGELMRDRARDVVRKSPSARGAIESYTSNAIGTGITPLSQHKDPAIREQIHTAWNRWTRRSDFDDMLDFYGQQALSFRAMMEAGESLFRFRIAPKEMRMRIPLQLELLEADHLPLNIWPTSLGQIPEGHTVKSGVEFDAAGRRVAYHLFVQHPYETVFFTLQARVTTRVPASDIIHLYRPLRPKQIRGETWLTAVMTKLWDLDRYDDSELNRKALVSALTGFITGAADNGDGSPLPSDGQPDPNAPLSQVATELETGTFLDLDPGESVTFANPPDVGGQYETFFRQQLRLIARGIGLTYEMLTGDLTGVNYSSIRAGLIEFRRLCEQIQHQIFIHKVCDRVYREWLRVGVLSGGLDLPMYMVDPEQYEDIKWTPPGWPWVDPLKDTTASILAINNGLTSRSTVVNESGENVEQVDRENAADRERERELGISYNENAPLKQETSKLAMALLTQPEDAPTRIVQ